MKLYIAKVNGKLLKAAREDWNWEEAQKHLKQTYGEDAVIEFVSSMPEENFMQSAVDLVVNHPEFSKEKFLKTNPKLKEVVEKAIKKREYRKKVLNEQQNS